MISFIGGTGPEGRGLALRFALSGEEVFLGSRSQGRGLEIASSLKELADIQVEGGTNKQAARSGEIIVVATPYDGHKETLTSLSDELHGKIIIDVVAPLTFSNGIISATPVEEGSAAVQAQQILPSSRVVGAFHNISAADLLVPSKPIDSDVIVCADDDEAKKYVIELSEKIEGIRGIDGGRLENSKYSEELTALLLNINKIYKAHSSIRITGI